MLKELVREKRKTGSRLAGERMQLCGVASRKLRRAFIHVNPYPHRGVPTHTHRSFAAMCAGAAGARILERAPCLHHRSPMFSHCSHWRQSALGPISEIALRVVHGCVAAVVARTVVGLCPAVLTPPHLCDVEEAFLVGSCYCSCSAVCKPYGGTNTAFHPGYLEEF